MKVNNLDVKGIFPKESSLFFSKLSLSYAYKVKVNTIIMAEGGSQSGKVNLTKKDCFIDYHIYKIEPLNNTINNYYLFSFLKYKYEELKRNQNGVLPSISKTTLLNMNVPIFENQVFYGKLFKLFDDVSISTNNELSLLEEKKNILLRKIFI